MKNTITFTNIRGYNICVINHNNKKIIFEEYEMLLRFDEQYLPMRTFEADAETLDDAYIKAKHHFRVNLNKIMAGKFYKVTILEN